MDIYTSRGGECEVRGNTHRNRTCRIIYYDNNIDNNINKDIRTRM